MRRDPGKTHPPLADSRRESIARDIAALDGSGANDLVSQKALRAAQEMGIRLSEVIRAHIEAHLDEVLFTHQARSGRHPSAAAAETSDIERATRRVSSWTFLASHIISASKFTWHELKDMWR
jgi:hypothetical protein